ncbi:transcriptional regulator, ArsR family [Bosea lathyri]|uniref:Transcriptional regulator, ArsR family n=2 Tax=Bosea lathyri TaxID=1036778 RepID=A0A1H6B9C7_9HYPH|nr:transcriptional regulator, ArsR family [Bosea lathyri]
MGLYFWIDLIKLTANYWGMDRFIALADPTRRRIVEMLGEAPLGAGEITARFSISAPAISQHLKVLKEAGLVSVEVRGQRRIYRLDPAGLDAFDAWVRKVRGFWGARLDGLEQELEKPVSGEGEA